jgi:Histidine kinase-like ATPase domain
VPGSGASTVGRWAPASAAELTAHRRQLSAVLHDGHRPPDAREGAVERLLLAFEELASNALRHGGSPVEAVVTSTGTGWLLEVSDAAADSPPVPAIGRDAALGGLGLYLIAQVCSAHGWTTAGDGRKVVWARVDHTRDEAASDAARWVPRPRGEGDGADRRR